MYIRFQTDRTNPLARCNQGFINAAFAILDDEVDDVEVDPYTKEAIKEILDWYGSQLDIPDRLSKSTKKYAEPIGICWFKSTATKHIDQALRLCALLESLGVRTHRITSSRPGLILYEDEFQIVVRMHREQ